MTAEKTDIANEEQVDLTNCDREPIHLLGNVQSYGCLIATTSDFMITQVSENISDILGLDPHEVLGSRLDTFLPAQSIHDIRTKLQVLHVEASVARLFGYDVLANGQSFDISVHAIDQRFVFEFEPKTDEHNRDEMSLVQPLISRVQKAEGVIGACNNAARAVQLLSGFDRVMIYKFDSDGSGEVIAERCQPRVESFLGLRYPASDIPKQARALYLRSTLRLIADVNSNVSPIMPQMAAHGETLDLSLAVTRAVSPIHLEYLRNMGVIASMSVSIIVDGQLWGLIACHHESPRYIDFERRTAIELFAQLFSYELVRKVDEEIRIELKEARQLHDKLMVRLSGGTGLINGFDTIADELTDLIPSDGMAIYSEGTHVSRGLAPSEPEFKRLIRFLNTAPTNQIYATDHVRAVYPEIDNCGADIAGLLAIPISRTPRDFIIFFRRQVSKSIKWAGDPNKPVQSGPNGVRLTPRKSFEAWVEEVGDHSERWTENQKNIAETLRVFLIEIVLKLTDDAKEVRQKAAEKQELLIAELNHRVRNILGLIQSLVSQSSSGADSVATYTKVLDSRISALARAHDQLTRQEWSPASLRALIEIEVGAFLTDTDNRLLVTGAYPILKPAAFSTIALVIHELVTNSTKYGALSASLGQVAITLDILNDGTLLMKWREIGGPVVHPPNRQGFGTTIIERTIPYELGGKVELRYQLSGLEADLFIPPKWLASVQENRVSDQDTKISPVVRDLTGEVLVVEDNMLLALDLSDMLTKNGAAYVHMAGTVEEAINIVQTVQAIELALLDVNLGHQTSLAVAKELKKRKVPFILATGYSDNESVTTSYGPAAVINKPLTSDSLKRAINAVLEKGAS